MTPATVHTAFAEQTHAARREVLDAAYAARPRALRTPPTPTASAPHRRLDQQARQTGGRSLNSLPTCLIGLDRLRKATPIAAACAATSR
jgi:hypothetical protein